VNVCEVLASQHYSPAQLQFNEVVYNESIRSARARFECRVNAVQERQVYEKVLGV